MIAREIPIVRSGWSCGSRVVPSATALATAVKPAGSHVVRVGTIEASDRAISPAKPKPAAPSDDRIRTEPRNVIDTYTIVDNQMAPTIWAHGQAGTGSNR